MGHIVSTLLDNLCACFGRETNKDIEYVTPTNIQRDIEPDISNLDYETNDLYDMRNFKYSTLDRLEHGTRIKYYILNNGKRIDMIYNIN